MDTVSIRESTTEVLVVGSETPTLAAVDSAPVLRLRLRKPKPDHKVGWREGTVDNEEMGRKKSKCCCIYKKPVNFGESSSSDDEECEHCFGHPEKRRKNKKPDQSTSYEQSNSPDKNDANNPQNGDESPKAIDGKPSQPINDLSQPMDKVK